jgi:hypothetical protein
MSKQTAGAAMSSTKPRVPAVVTLLAAAALVAGCGDPGSGTGNNATARGDIDRCALLTDDEVGAAIGPHDGGSTGSLDRPNAWGGQSCRWTATASRDIEGLGTWSDAVEVAVFQNNREDWARDQASGEPVEGLGEGALYDESYGDLWFGCGAGRFCAVKVRTASSENREQNAHRLAGLVRERVR